MDFRHISKKLSQVNKSFKGSSKGRSAGGKVETRNVMSGRTNLTQLNKEQRYSAMVEQRKALREEMLMKRRGLNFVTEHHEQLLDQSTIEACETQLDNVAPKVVGLLALGSTADTTSIRRHLVKHCLLYQQQTQQSKKSAEARDIDDIMEEEEALASQLSAYLCPNPGSSTNCSSKKQRLIFQNIDKNDPLSCLDVAKTADIVLVVMSCKDTNVSGVKQDPFEHSKAIDEIDYKALHLLRSQGIPTIVGVLQHLEHISSSKHSYVKKLFERIFVSEFTSKYKFMHMNASTEQQAATDASALLRQIAVTFPDTVSWKENRSYMLGEVSHVREDEVHFKGYIRGNFLNAKRLIHVTGLTKIGWKVKRIEIAQDPCPVKLTAKEKDKVLSTSRAQSIVSSRNSSRQSSRKGSFDNEPMATQDIDEQTGTKCVQSMGKQIDRDDDKIENNPGMFSAEQTWPTEDEMKRNRKGSMQEDDTMPKEIDQEPLDLDQIKPALKKPKEGADLANMFGKMQISVVGRENQEDNNSDFQDSEEEEEDDEEDDEDVSGEGDEEHAAEVDPLSKKHIKYADLEERAAEDMDFPDEVDTPFKNARVRYQKYRGVKSLRNCDWDPYENLPQEYSKIHRIDNYHLAQKTAIQQVQEEGLPLNGTFLTIVLEMENPEESNQFTMGQTYTISTLHPNETKLTVCHMKIKRTTENKDVVASKTPMQFHCGFRRFTAPPIFSQEIKAGLGSDKSKFLRFLRTDDSQAIATVYCPLVFTPCKVLCFTEASLKSTKVDCVVATGTMMTPNPLKVVLKRIVLTGYPFRVHKKKATVRYMFFEPKDIKWFKPVELYTRNGLKGHIKQGLGTHGLMKCVFNDFVKHSDVMCMPLYRRVFPVWNPQTWDPNGEPVKLSKYEIYDAEAEKKKQEEEMDLEEE